MKAIKIVIIALICAMIFTSAAGVTRITKTGATTSNLYTDAWL